MRRTRQVCGKVDWVSHLGTGAGLKVPPPSGSGARGLPAGEGARPTVAGSPSGSGARGLLAGVGARPTVAGPTSGRGAGGLLAGEGARPTVAGHFEMRGAIDYFNANLSGFPLGGASVNSTQPSIISTSLEAPQRMTFVGSGFIGLFAELSKCASIFSRVPLGI